ncbi:MAG: hypothetical protein M3X11_02530, partial [Acidobacteriota bacterium]|nr:hypothetical protein [Acidobacteriota bacterium]
IMGRTAVNYLYADADVIVRPQIEHVRPDDLSKAAEMIAAGEEAARRVIHKVRRLLIPRRQGVLKRIFGKPQHNHRRVTMLEED